MNIEALRGLADSWRDEARLLRRRGAPRQADVLESAAEDLEDRLGEWLREPLTIPEAASESGYSEDYLRELVREGRLPDSRPPGSQRPISIRRTDLPRKVPEPDAEGPVREMADTIRASRRR